MKPFIRPSVTDLIIEISPVMPVGIKLGPQSQPKSLGDFLRKFLDDGSDQVL